MTPLLLHLSQSYAAHSSFRFDASPWPLDATAFQAFESAYRSLRKGAAISLPACERALADVFDALSAAGPDAMELRFLAELRADCLRLLREEAAHFAAVRAPADAGDAGKVSELRRQRYFFGALPSGAVHEMLRAGSSDLATFRDRAREGQLRRDDLSVNAGESVRRIARLLNHTFGADGTLDAVSGYVGRSMRVSGVALELSVPQATWWANALPDLPRPAHTLYAHLDETVALPKSIVYLSEVGPDNGPTSCYPGVYEQLALHPLQELVGRVLANVGASAVSPLHAHYGRLYHQSISSEAFRRHFMRLPEALRFNSHLGWDVMPDSRFEAAMVASEKSMTGPAGTCIVFDGARLFHRGGLMRAGERIALQVVFGPKPTLGQRIARKVKAAIA